jgi:hypothetical protein
MWRDWFESFLRWAMVLMVMIGFAWAIQIHSDYEKTNRSFDVHVFLDKDGYIHPAP